MTSRASFAPLFAAVVGLSLPLATGCIGDDLLGQDDLAETSSDLLVSSWTLKAPTRDAYFGGQVAILNGTTYMVSSGRCGSWTCGGASESKELYWQKRTGTGWSNAVRIPGQSSSSTVSLAPFNGYLYMVHTGSSDGSTELWLSHFDPSTETWSTNYKLPFPTFSGPPAIAAYNGQLYFIGTQAGTWQMWMATMNAGEVFTYSAPLSGRFSASRPSAAVYNSRLYVAHRNGETAEAVISSFNGSSWTAKQYINAAAFGAPIRALAPTLAAVNGYLHLIHRTPESNSIWWTYYNSCKWAPELTLGTLTSTLDPQVTQGAPGLVLATTDNVTWNSVLESRLIQTSLFTAPPAPITLPRDCLVVQP